mmetsp:Transcript_13926/g.13557  ORF Transcript_13926/g.13557 Transcript_13926/m.13557 type:complete len:82 (-) Transcript_13926:490-735(-)
MMEKSRSSEGSMRIELQGKNKTEELLRVESSQDGILEKQMISVQKESSLQKILEKAKTRKFIDPETGEALYITDCRRLFLE